MGDCVHPRSQGYTDDQNRSRCGACGDVWDDTLYDGQGGFRPLVDRIEGMAVPMNKPRVIVVDVRHGQVRADGSNIDLPVEGQQSALRSIELADVLVEVHEDGIFVKQGVNKGWVTMFTTKSPAQLNAEKADREKADRVDSGGEKATGMTGDRATFADDPVDAKFKRVWDGSVKSGEPVKGGLKGY